MKRPVRIALKRILERRPCLEELSAFCRAFQIKTPKVIARLEEAVEAGCRCCKACQAETRRTVRLLAGIKTFHQVPITKTFTYDEIAATQKRYRRGKTWTEWIWRRILTETEQNRIDPKRAAA